MFSPVQPSIFGTVQSTQIFFRKKMERTTGIEPASSAWEADILPMNYVRISSYIISQKLLYVNSAAGPKMNRRPCFLCNTQSSSSYIIIASAAIPAVSVLSMVFPNVTVAAPAAFSLAISPSLKPPSGPITSATRRA